MIPAVSFAEAVSELIRRRFSCRTFAAAEIEPAKRSGIDGLLRELTGQAGGKIRLEWIDKNEIPGERLFKSGTYGLIKGSRFFVAGIMRAITPRIWEDLGTIMETLVLKLTEWGFATCWIGGIFDRKHFGKHLDLGKTESLPVVVAIGHAAEKPSRRDRMVRWSARGDLRRPPAELFFLGSIGRPLLYEEFPHFRSLLESLRLAPSASNKQPWRVLLVPPQFHFYLDRDRVYSRLARHADLQRIDMGIGRCHFHFSALEAGIRGEWFCRDPEIPGLPARFEYSFSFQTDFWP